LFIIKSKMKLKILFTTLITLILLISLINFSSAIWKREVYDYYGSPTDYARQQVNYSLMNAENFTGVRADFSGNVTSNWFKGIFNWSDDSPLLSFDGSILSFDFTQLNNSYDLRYYAINNPSGFYNSTDFSISDYFTKTNILDFNYYNSTSLTSNTQLLNGNNYWNDTFATFNQTFADTLYNPLGTISNSLSWNRSGTNVFLSNVGDNVGIGTTSPLGKLDVRNDASFDLLPTSAGQDNIFLGGAFTEGDGNFGASIGFSRMANVGRRGGAITLVQTGTDRDQDGLAFFVHPSVSSDTNIVEAMRINSDGKVGIGTTSPEVILEVKKDGSNQTSMRIRNDNTDANRYSELQFSYTDGDATSGLRGYAVAPGGNHKSKLLFFTRTAGNNLNEALLIDEAGKVGIGTTSPQNELNVIGDINATGKLYVYGGGELTGQYDFNGGWTSNGLSIINGDLYAQTGYFYNISGLDVNNLLINGSLLPVEGFDNQFDVGNSTLRWKDLNLGGEVHADGTGDSYFMGDVGIGTTSPDSLLHVAGNILNTGSNVKIKIDSSDNAFLEIDRSATNYRSAIKFTTADSLNWVMGTTDSDDHGDGSEFYIGTTESGGSEKFWIDSDGNVGIGTTSPQNTLNIIGDFNQTNGYSYFNSLYGNVWFHNDAGVSAGTLNDTYQIMEVFSLGESGFFANGFTNSSKGLMLSIDGGIYRAKWEATGSGINNHKYSGAIYINEIMQNNTKTHMYADANDEVRMAKSGIIEVSQYDNITIRVADIGGTSAGTIYDASIDLSRVGN